MGLPVLISSCKGENSFTPHSSYLSFMHDLLSRTRAEEEISCFGADGPSNVILSADVYEEQAMHLFTNKELTTYGNADIGCVLHRLLLKYTEVSK